MSTLGLEYDCRDGVQAVAGGGETLVGRVHSGWDYHDLYPSIEPTEVQDFLWFGPQDCVGRDVGRWATLSQGRFHLSRDESRSPRRLGTDQGGD